MKVVALALSYPPARMIGAEVALHALLRHLVGRGHDVEVVTTTNTGRRVLDGVRIAPAGTRRPQGDVVVVNAGLGGKARLWWPRTEVVVWAHNNQLPTLLDVRAAKGHLVTNTSHMRDVYRAVLNQDSAVLHPPVNPAAPCLGGDAVTLVNLTPDKGSHVFWDLASRHPAIPFLGVKGGYGAQDVRDLPNVTVIDHGDLEDVWARTRILLLPSRHESYSMTAAEAITRGIPAVAADLPGVREACGHGAVYARTDWGAALTRAMDDWDALSTNALVHAACRRTAGELDTIAALIEGFRTTEQAA